MNMPARELLRLSTSRYMQVPALEAQALVYIGILCCPCRYMLYVIPSLRRAADLMMLGAQIAATAFLEVA